MSAGVEAWSEVADPELSRMLGSTVQAILSEQLSPDLVVEFTGEAFLACHDQGASGAVKLLFDRFAD